MTFTPKPEPPESNELSQRAYLDCQRDARVLRGDWTVTDWLWEEIRQREAVFRMQQATIRKLRDQIATLPPPCSPVSSGSSASDATP